MSKSRTIFIVSIITVHLFALVSAQVTTGTILGTIKDQSGAVLPGVSVIVENVDTGAAREMVTDDRGRYRASQLPLGNYRVEASLAGFQTGIRAGLKLTVGREALVDFELVVGEIAELIQVTGDAPLVETTSSTLSGLVDDKKIRDLPLNGRSFSDLITLQTGTVKQTLGSSNASSGFGTKISVAGARPSENSFLLDGNFVNDTLNNTPAGVTGLFLGVETLREFTVLTSTFSAEYGQSAGAVVSAVTKSGTNEVHGSVFYFHRNSVLDAKNFFDQEKDPPFRRHQFGGVIGGPIVENKTFFFGGYEGLREGLGLTQIIDTLTPEARQGIIPGQPPIQIAPGISDYFILYPLPNGRAKSPGAAEHIFSVTDVSEEDNVVIKIDHNLSDSDSMFVRYTFDDAEVLSPGVNFAGLLESRNQYVTIEEKKVFSATTLNIARFGFNRSVLSLTDSALIDLPPNLQLVPLEQSAVPDLAEGLLGGIFVTGLGDSRRGGIGNSNNAPRIYHFNLFEYSDTLSYMNGAHSFKFGANIKRVQANMISPQRVFGSLTLGSITDFLEGNASNFQFIEPGSDVIRGIRFTVMGFFVQDDIQLRPNLTLNLGLRYEPSTGHSEVNGKLSNLLDIRNDAELSIVENLYENPTEKNFAPRIGLAWDPFGRGKTAVRAGFGIFYNTQMAELDRITTTSNPPFASILALSNLTFPFDFDDVLSGALTTTPALELIDRNAGQPYRIQYNLNLQHEVLPYTTLTVGYVGGRGINLFNVYNANQPDPIPSTDPSRPTSFFFPAGLGPLNPNFRQIVYRDTGGDSYYNSLQISLSKRFSSGFQVQGSYTFSKSIDTGSKQVRGNAESAHTNGLMNPLDTSADRGPSEFDVPNTLTINYTVDLPGQQLGGAAGQLLGGWQLGGIMTFSQGVPFTILAGYDSCRCLNGRSGGSPTTDNRPDLVPGGDDNPVLGGPDHYFDEFQFVPGPFGYYGNLGRDTLRIPGVNNIDFSLSKKLSLREGVDLQFRAEMFNVFNRSNFSAPAATLFQFSRGAVSRRGGVGRITSTTTTSRQIQFALKIIF